MAYLDPSGTGVGRFLCLLVGLMLVSAVAFSLLGVARRLTPGADRIPHPAVSQPVPEVMYASPPEAEPREVSLNGGPTAGSPAGPQATATSPPQPEWRRVTLREGTGDGVIEPFTIQSQQFRLAYRVQDRKSGTPQVCIAVRTAPGGHLVVGGGCYRQNGTTQLDQGPGAYSLEIRSLDRWSVLIEEYR
jgi:hypothetical protein